jgi:hypothetical protein
MDLCLRRRRPQSQVNISTRIQHLPLPIIFLPPLTMHFSGLIVFSLAISASALPGLLHDEAHHTHEVLDNLHSTPHCAYRCIFNESYKAEWAPECANAKEGKDTGACYCRTDAYQYIVDQCWERSCGAGQRKKVIVY